MSILKRIGDFFRGTLEPRPYSFENEPPTKRAQSKKYTEEEMMLALAWADDFVTLTTVQRKLKQWGVRENVYTFLARTLRQNYVEEREEI